MKCYKFALHKSYFDKGYGELSFAKYFLFLLGFDSVLRGSLKFTMILGVCYVLVCYLLGMFLYKVGWVDAIQEVSNQFDPFEREVRKKLKIQDKVKNQKI